MGTQILAQSVRADRDSENSSSNPLILYRKKEKRETYTHKKEVNVRLMV